MSIQSEITRINDEVSMQSSLIRQIGEVLATKVAGGEVPDGWVAGYAEVIIDSETADTSFVFNGVPIDPNNLVFFCWTDLVASSAVSYKRIAAGYISFDELYHSQVFMQNVSSTGTTVGGSQLDVDEVTIVNSAGNMTVTVSYVSTRRFKSGNTYKAIVFGKKGIT